LNTKTSNEKATIVINVNQSNIFNIYLYAISGKMVKDIYNGKLQTGRHEIVIDLTAYQSGSYLIVINSKTQKESLRLEKLE
ncbi:MAG: T9SS type A sorting domain-containing protein, partial [Crocinitomicaceae bacterium]|nr:T9SS type A sorting domain-containing protein [Crocinitomicaceae bacterium]